MVLFVGVAAYSSGGEGAEQQCEIPADRTPRECVQVSERDMKTSVKTPPYYLMYLVLVLDIIE